jgi:hypothetical protein
MPPLPPDAAVKGMVCEIGSAQTANAVKPANAKVVMMDEMFRFVFLVIISFVVYVISGLRYILEIAG